jgi:hypothetical protein
VTQQENTVAPEGKTVRRAVREIRRSLSSIGSALERLAPVLERAAVTQQPSGRGGAREPRGRRLQPPHRRLAALRLHGQYIGYMRNLKPRQKAQVRALRERKGVEAAIALGRKFARS